MVTAIRKDALDAILKAHVAESGSSDTKDKLLGAAFVVVGYGETLYSGAAGRLSFEDDSPEFSVDSIAWTASLTKLVTAVCLLQLVDKGLIKLDDDAREHVPWLKEAKILTDANAANGLILEDNTAAITLKQLLTHTAGFDYDSSNVREENRQGDGFDDYRTPLVFRPGTGWVYGSSYDWAGQLLEKLRKEKLRKEKLTEEKLTEEKLTEEKLTEEKLTEETLGTYMQENIFQWLGMCSMSFRPSDFANETRAVVAVRSEEDGTLSLSEYVPPESHLDSGGSGLYGSAADYAAFLGAVLRGDLVSDVLWNEMFVPQLDPEPKARFDEVLAEKYNSMVPEFEPGTPMNHSLAGIVNEKDVTGKRRLLSLAGGGMLNSRWWIDRETGIAAVFFTSLSPAGDPVVKKVYDELERTVYSEIERSRPNGHNR